MASTRRFRPWHGGFRTRPGRIRRNAAFVALAHVLLGSLDAPGTSTEHTTCPVRRSSSALPLRHVGRLAEAAQLPSDALRLGDEREPLHLSAAPSAGQHVEPQTSPRIGARASHEPFAAPFHLRRPSRAR